MAVFTGHGEVEDINIYDDVQTMTPEETPKSGLRLIRLAVVGFGVLFVIQATLNISLRLVFFKNLTRERDQLQTTLNNVTKERDALQKRLCGTNDEWKVFGSSCYYVSTEEKTWNESRQDCQQRGADLVVINNREEQEFLFTFNKDVWVWIGLSDRDVEGNWTWVDGTPLTTAYWASGQPNNGDGTLGEDCAAITNYNPDPVNRWFDWGCDNRHSRICERGI